MATRPPVASFTPGLCPFPCNGAALCCLSLGLVTARTSVLGQSPKHALEWAATALPLGPCLSFCPERQVQALQHRALRPRLKLVQGTCRGVRPLNWFPAGLWSCRYEKGRSGRGGKGQDMVLLSLGKELGVGASSGEAEGPAIAPCPVIAVGKGGRQAVQEKGYKKRPLTQSCRGGRGAAWQDLAMVTLDKADASRGCVHAVPFLCMAAGCHQRVEPAPDPLSLPFPFPLLAGSCRWAHRAGCRPCRWPRG